MGCMYRTQNITQKKKNALRKNTTKNKQQNAAAFLSVFILMFWVYGLIDLYKDTLIHIC